jgi:uncharacterized protein (TIGR03067 family)
MERELEQLQGTWTVTTLELEGQRFPSAMLGGASLVIQGDRFISNGMGAVYEGTVTLDASATPHRLDLHFDAGPEAGHVNPGIYRLEGDSCLICLATRGSERPGSFESPPGSGIALETLARAANRGPEVAAAAETPSAAPPPPASEGSELEGEWRMVSGIIDGVPMQKSVVGWVRRVTRGNLTTVEAGPQVMTKMEFTTDSSQSPNAIDYIHLAGPNQGQLQRGIYAFESGVLKICVSAPGAARPSEFRSERGEGGMLTVWRRV